MAQLLLALTLGIIGLLLLLLLELLLLELLLAHRLRGALLLQQFLLPLLFLTPAFFLRPPLSIGLLLLLLRISVSESGMFREIQQNDHVSRGNFLALFTNWNRFVRFLRCLLIGFPTWFVVGVLITLAPEFGAAKIPATPEAILVAMLDNLDAKTFMALNAARTDRGALDSGGTFTEKIWALDTKLYRPNPLG